MHTFYCFNFVENCKNIIINHFQERPQPIENSLHLLQDAYLQAVEPAFQAIYQDGFQIYLIIQENAPDQVPDEWVKYFFIFFIRISFLMLFNII